MAEPFVAPAVGAVVVNYDGGERVLATVAALRRQEAPPAEIVVVDNGSSDGSPARLRADFPGVRVLELGENRGLATARNIGLRSVDTPLVLLIDHDVYTEPDCLRRLLDAYAGERAAVVCPRIRLIPERDVVQADGAEPHFIGTMLLRRGFTPAGGLPEEPQEVGGGIGACYLLDRRAVLDAGGFDERYFIYFEDLEFCLRMRALGQRIVLAPRALVFHDRGDGTPQLSFRGRGVYPRRRAYLHMRNRLLTVALHYRARTLLVLAPALALYEAGSLAAAFARGFGLEWCRAWLWNARNARGTFRRRRWIQSRRRVPDRALLTGGPLPLAQGFLRSDAARAAAAALSGALDLYWRMARRFIG